MIDRATRARHQAGMRTRDETPDDISAVRQVVEAAFGRADEADLVDALRRSGDAAISLVAEDDSEIVGHVLFSRLAAPGQCLALAPVSVTPMRQDQGIGSRLIRDGLARAMRDGWQAVFVLGKPAYYERFGFRVAAAAMFETPYPKAYFMALELAPDALSERHGVAIYPPPFNALD